MKSNKTLFFAALAVGGLIACGPARAQDATSTTNIPAVRAPGTMTNGMPRALRSPNIDRMATSLGLSDDQKSKVQSAYNDESQKIRAIIQDNSLSRDEKKAKIMDLRKDMSGQMKSILTPEQYQKWTGFQSRFRRSTAAPQMGAGTNAPAAPTQ